MAFVPPPPPGLPLGARPGSVVGGITPTLPSAAAAAGAAAAALLQRQLAADSSPAGRDALPDGGWTEHQTGDGRKFYFHEETQTSTWEKPEVLRSAEERNNDTKWREYRIWDGRVFYHNKETKVSCWSVPPEIRKLRGESSGIDDRPLPLTAAEQRQAFWDLMKERGVDETWTWSAVNKATGDDPRAETLNLHSRKQCFSELLSFLLHRSQIEAREKQRNAASALERLIEERFSRPEDLGATYEDAARLLAGEEPWQLIKSDARRDEVFQSVMERLEEKHQKARADQRAERVLRLQRLIATDSELRRTRLRWKDAAMTLARRDELQEEDPPLEALRVWSSLCELRPAAEHEAEAKAKEPSEFREERKRRDAFVVSLKDLAMKGLLTAETLWAELEAALEAEPRYVALRDGPGATAMELFDELQEDLRRGASMDGAARGGGGSGLAMPARDAPSVMVAAPAESDYRIARKRESLEKCEVKEEVVEPARKRSRFDALVVPTVPRVATEEEQPKAQAQAQSSPAASAPAATTPGTSLSATVPPLQKPKQELIPGAEATSAPQIEADCKTGQEAVPMSMQDVSPLDRLIAESEGANAAVKLAGVKKAEPSDEESAREGEQDKSEDDEEESEEEDGEDETDSDKQVDNKEPEQTQGQEVVTSAADGSSSAAARLVPDLATVPAGDATAPAPVTLAAPAPAPALAPAPSAPPAAAAEVAAPHGPGTSPAVPRAAAAVKGKAKLNSAELTAKKLDELRALCKKRGLAVSGRKSELVQRLLAAVG